MKAVLARSFVLGIAMLAAGCTTTGTAGVDTAAQVTRFHLNQPIARGDIAVVPMEADDAGTLEFARFAAAVERELTALGWTVVRGPTQPEQVAVVRISQGTRQDVARRPAVSLGLGGGFGGYRSGVGLGGGISLPVGGRSGPVVVTELAVRIQRRSDQTAIWEGRAITEGRGGTPTGGVVYAVDRLAPALFQGFPGESGRTIRVE